MAVTSRPRTGEKTAKRAKYLLERIVPQRIIATITKYNLSAFCYNEIRCLPYDVIVNLSV